MAISWDLLEGRPVSPGALVVQSVEYMRHITGHEGWRAEAQGYVLGRPWSWEQDRAWAPGPAVEFDVEVAVHLGIRTGRAHVISEQELEDHGSPVEGHASIEVRVDRTQTSAAVGLATALSAYALSGGDLSGEGLSRWHRPGEFDEVLDIFRPSDAESPALDAAVQRLGTMLGVAGLAL